MKFVITKVLIMMLVITPQNTMETLFSYRYIWIPKMDPDYKSHHKIRCLGTIIKKKDRF
jgi:hypothetical protein